MRLAGCGIEASGLFRKRPGFAGNPRTKRVGSLQSLRKIVGNAALLAESIPFTRGEVVGSIPTAPTSSINDLAFFDRLLRPCFAHEMQGAVNELGKPRVQSHAQRHYYRSPFPLSRASREFSR